MRENFTGGNGGFREVVASSSEARRYTLGLTATVFLRDRLGIEVDGLYRRLNYDSYTVEGSFGSGIEATTYIWSNTTGNRIDLPVLLRWSPIGHLYLDGGAAFAFHYGFAGRSTFIELPMAGGSLEYSTSGSGNPEELLRNVAEGATAGVGRDKRILGVHVKPEVRYTRWVNPAFDTSPAEPSPLRNEADFILGVEFGKVR